VAIIIILMRKTFISERPVKNTYGSSRPARSRFAILRTTTTARFTISEFTSKMSILIYFMCLVHWRRSKIINDGKCLLVWWCVRCGFQLTKRVYCNDFRGAHHVIILLYVILSWMYVWASALFLVCNGWTFH